MVNELDRKILAELCTGSCVSGEQIRTKCGISRVAVWKRIKKLQECGFDITSSAHGYTLLSVAYNLGKLADMHPNIEYYHTVDSTMDYELGYEADDILFLAECQKGGRARKDRVWESPPGGIYYTRVWKPNIPLESVMRLMLAAVLSVVKVLRKQGMEASAWWPNSIVVENDKIAGVLIEFTGEFDKVRQIKAGFGIHLGHLYERTLLGPTSSILEKMNMRLNVLLEQYEMFCSYINDLDAETILDEWKNLNTTLGKKVTVSYKNTKMQVTAKDISAEGLLLAETKSGTIIRVSSGDCVLSDIQ